MKNFILLLTSLTFSLVTSQNAPIDFEPGGNGDTWTWATFEAPAGQNNPTFSISPNPSIGVTNPSANVGKMVIEYPSTEVWGQAGCESMHGSDLGAFTIDASNSTVNMMIYQEVFAAPVALKFATNSGYALAEVVVPNTIADAWVEVEFDISAWTGNPQNPVDQIIFFPSYGPRGSGHTVYFDNITFGPYVAPPTLTYLNVDFETPSSFSGDVGIFSEIANPGPDPVNMSATVGQLENINGGLYANAQLTSSDAFDLSSADKGFSIKVKGPRAISNIKLKIEGGTNSERDLSYTTPGLWQELVYDFTSETSSNNTKLVIFFDFEGSASGLPSDDIIQFDDVIFDQYSTLLSTNDFELNQFKAYPNPTSNSWTIESNEQISKIEIFDILGKQTMALNYNTDQVSIDASNLSNGIYFAKIYSSLKTQTIRLIKK